MSLDQAQINRDLASALSAIASAVNLDAMKQIKIDFVGDKSPINSCPSILILLLDNLVTPVFGNSTAESFVLYK